MAPEPETPRQQTQHQHEGVLPHGDVEHGEGNYEAAHHYAEGVKRTLEEKDVEGLAEEAKEALEGDEGEELRAAEEEGKRHVADEDPEVYGKRAEERGAGKR